MTGVISMLLIGMVLELVLATAVAVRPQRSTAP